MMSAAVARPREARDGMQLANNGVQLFENHIGKLPCGAEA